MINRTVTESIARVNKTFLNDFQLSKYRFNFSFYEKQNVKTMHSLYIHLYRAFYIIRLQREKQKEVPV